MIGEMELTTDELATYQTSIWKDPVGWIYEVLGIELWPKQAEILDCMKEWPLVAVRSSNAAGKTYLAASIVPAFLMSHSPGYAITTAGSWRGVERALWPALRKIIRNSKIPLGGKLLKTSWELDDQWGAFGVSTDEPENFAGFRTPNPTLVIVDEASSLQREIWDAINGLCANGGHVLLIGNPLRNDGVFYDCFRSPSWKTFHISALDIPNVALGQVVLPGLATRTWVEERKKEYGEGTPFYQARVLGDFPDSADNSLIVLLWVEQARSRKIPKQIVGQKIVGVDIARYGSDRTVAILRDDVAVRDKRWWTKVSLAETVGRLKNLIIGEWGVDPENVFVDDSGVGGGVMDMLEDDGVYVNPINNAESAQEDDKFANIRAESFWNMRDALDPDQGEKALIIPEDDDFNDLAAEICQPQYKFDRKGRILIEAKDEIKKRLGRSPDCADALALTYARVTKAGTSDFIVR